MKFRTLEKRDINSFASLRTMFAQMMRPIENPDNFRELTKDYLEEHIDKDDLVIFIGVENEEIVCSCMACIFETAPLPSCPSGRNAEILNVYTKDEYRGHGYGETAVRMTLSELKKREVGKVILEASVMGHSLYERIRFLDDSSSMSIRL